MAETGGCGGVEALGLCLPVDPVLRTVLLAAVPLYGFLAAALTGPKWRARVRRWLRAGLWSEAYAAPLEAVTGWLDRRFGPPLGREALARFAFLALAYAFAFSVVQTARASGDPLIAVGLGAGGLLAAGSALGEDPQRTLLQIAAGTGAALVLMVAFGVADAGILRFMLVFGVGLVAINALFDWLSVAASRWLMARLAEDARRPGWAARAGTLLGHLALDLALAAACLFGLAAAAAAAARLGGTPAIWDGFWSAARDAPLEGGGAVMTAMLLTTLAPTALHLFFAIFALAALRPPLLKATAAWLEEDAEGGERGTQLLVALYLSAAAVAAAVTLWALGRLALAGADLAVGGEGLWATIFDAAEAAFRALG